MRVLFVSSWLADYVSACLFRGLQDVLGMEHVVLATPIQTAQIPCQGQRVLEHGDGPFDLMVVCDAFIREADWNWPTSLRTLLRPGGKVAFVEGRDGANEYIDPLNDCRPPFHCDAYFRREIDPSFHYPYGPIHHLTMAAPTEWIDDGHPLHKRDIDVFACFSPHEEVRWGCLGAAFDTKEQGLRTIASSYSIGHEEYRKLLRNSKLCVCPSGGARSDTLRTYEAAATGAIPVFVNYPPWWRQDWFDDSNSFMAASAAELPQVLDHALSCDLPAMRGKLLEAVRKNHTCEARARKMLEVLGL